MDDIKLAKKVKSKIAGIEVEIEGNPSYVLSGQLLKGRLILNVINKLTDIHAIVAEAHGDGYTMLRPVANAGEGNVRHGQWKEYLKCSNVLASPDENNPLTIDPGRHEFPFTFLLPHYIPSSYSAGNKNYNYIRYWIKGIIKLSKDRSITTFKPVKVREKVALSTLQMQEEPRPIELTQSLCCSILRPGSVHLTFVTDRKAYCTGQSIIIAANVENLTHLRLKSLRVDLCRSTAIIAEGNSKTLTTKCASIVSEAIEAGETMEWQNKSFPLPEDLIPTSHTSALIQTQYELVVTVVIPMTANLSFRQGIGIATVIDTEDDVKSKYQQHQQQVFLQRQLSRQLSRQPQNQQRQRQDSTVTDV